MEESNEKIVTDILIKILSKLSEDISQTNNAEELKELCSAVCGVVVTLFNI